MRHRGGLKRRQPLPGTEPGGTESVLRKLVFTCQETTSPRGIKAKHKQTGWANEYLADIRVAGTRKDWMRQL
jgi:hypothetical protein